MTEPTFARVTAGGKVHVLDEQAVSSRDAVSSFMLGLVGTTYCGREIFHWSDGGVVSAFFDSDLCASCYRLYPISERDQLFLHPEGCKYEDALFHSSRLDRMIGELISSHEIEEGDMVSTSDGPMFVAQVSPHDGGRVLVTDDGGTAYRSEWHTGPSEHEVHYKVYDGLGGVVAHGWIDSTSRRLTQSG